MFVSRNQTSDLIGGPNSVRRLKHVRRRGFTIVELICTLILLGVVFTVTISVLTAVGRERRSTEQRQYALQHAANLLEHATAQDWSKLPEGPQELPTASADLQALLPELDQRLEVTKATEGAKRLTVSVRWKNRHGQLVSPLQLTTWVYPIEEPQP
jgi:prepilin-type N-terminal cleavage/methylation domain-containing protein